MSSALSLSQGRGSTRNTMMSTTVLLVWVAIAVLPLNLEVVLQRTAGPDDSLHRVSLTPEDPVLLGLFGLALWSLIFRGRRVPSGLALTFAAVWVTTGLALTQNPSLRGLQAFLRVAELGGLAWALSIVLDSRWRFQTLLVLAGTAAAETALGVAQVLTGHVLGLTGIGEYPPLLPFGSVLAAKGTFTHPYLFAGFAVVVATGLAVCTDHGRIQRRGALTLAAAVAAVPLGLTYSRMSVLAVVGVLIALVFLPRRQPRLWMGSAALTLGAIVPGLITRGGWVSRVQQASDAISVDALSSSRVTFFKQAWDLFREHPLFGVGPGEYMHALAQDSGQAGPLLFPVHDVPVLLTVEGGLFVGLAVAAFGVALAMWLRAGRRTAAIVLCYLPFLLLDHPISHPQGVTVMGVWLGLVCYVGRSERRTRQCS